MSENRERAIEELDRQIEKLEGLMRGLREEGRRDPDNHSAFEEINPLDVMTFGVSKVVRRVFKR